MDLRNIIEEISAGVEFELEKLPHHPVDAIGQVCDNAIEGYRTLAGCALLLDGDTDSYYHLLAHAGSVRLYFLRRCQREQPDLRNGFRATGNNLASISVLAAGHVDLAKRIAEVSSKSWWEGEEYAEDFYFGHFFNLLAAEPLPDRSEVRQAVAGLKLAMADGGARLDLCQALGDRSQEAFDAAFGAFLTERKAILDEAGDPFTPYEAAARRVDESLYTEGLAILRMAELLGLKTEPEYQLCPAEARLPMKAPFPRPPSPLEP